ncbi:MULTISPECIES: preprotein translocase subunit SecG [Mameliella]|jgi:preprotein translocase subunit SecG|uniref:Protein-export membrane protein SecG n=1 Tax=Mameliella alba TaxID=561184 RepID=A0A0B3S5U8_9RHOB|nr:MULTISPECIES: preprotein translocase subunit SecG [Mameliella]MBV6638141.1 preprotein translocase subunit SecG [Mameliella sp.]MCR9273269.1 preprotein translocase subunit SecG [Paracoccaceae bacterium]KHQ54353.1 Preprotein translocase, SecG subunit [Mameliella alba]MBY6118489.1 preprotein translocase subunit SecG [Mameliella alba]OWV43244.1 preprotein translocase subunit SecG [Mameliella alba]
MENVILIVHLLLALGLIGVVLLQRSEGGGLGIGGGGGAMSQRAPLTALGKLTWILAVGFIITSITLTIIAAQNASGSSILDRLGTQEPATDAPAPAPGLDGIDPNALVPPPSADGGDADAPLVPRAD